jgi:sRNA-binding carbon storage regulator CsrA
MLRLTVGTEDYIQINDDIRITFLGGSQKNTRVMIDAPKEVTIARGKAIKKHEDQNP